MVDEIMKIYTSGAISKMGYAKGKLLGVYLAVNHFADHFKVVRKSKRYNDDFSATIAATLLGDGARLKAESFGFAQKLCQKLGKARGNA